MVIEANLNESQTVTFNVQAVAIQLTQLEDYNLAKLGKDFKSKGKPIESPYFIAKGSDVIIIRYEGAAKKVRFVVQA